VRDKYLVYILKTVNDPTKYYTGLTSDLDARLEKHNAGGCPSTASSRPWEVDVVIEFKDERRAAALERYLKSSRVGSSRPRLAFQDRGIQRLSIIQ
jgi:putative endonuclease